MSNRTKTSNTKIKDLELNMKLIMEVTELINKSRDAQRIRDLSDDLRELVRLRQEIKDNG